MLNEITGNILDITEGIICHQVNTHGVMGAGLALQIKNKWSYVFDLYKDFCYASCRQHFELLGACVLAAIVPDILYVANIFGQVSLTRGTVNTQLKAVEKAFRELKDIRDKLHAHLPIYVPYKMGCGLGGGNWTKYEALVESIVPDAIVVKLPE